MEPWVRIINGDKRNGPDDKMGRDKNQYYESTQRSLYSPEPLRQGTEDTKRKGIGNQSALQSKETMCSSSVRGLLESA